VPTPTNPRRNPFSTAHSAPKGVLSFAEASWHNDDGIGMSRVKFATYFDLLTGADGALRFRPGSHHPEHLAWTIVYRRGPKSDTEQERTGRSMTDAFEQAFRGFDRERHPIWRDWLADAGSHPERAAVIKRMRAGGVLALPTAEVGW
jgi:hypothetical protein